MIGGADEHLDLYSSLTSSSIISTLLRFLLLSRYSRTSFEFATARNEDY